MRTAQIIFIFLLFILAMIVLTLPVWIDRALPIMKDSINSAGKTLRICRLPLLTSGKDFLRILQDGWVNYSPTKSRELPASSVLY
jgi:hypothetical protein